MPCGSFLRSAPKTFQKAGVEQNRSVRTVQTLSSSSSLSSLPLSGHLPGADTALRREPKCGAPSVSTLSVSVPSSVSVPQFLTVSHKQHHCRQQAASLQAQASLQAAGSITAGSR